MPELNDWWSRAKCLGMAPLFDRPNLSAQLPARVRDRRLLEWQTACARVCNTCDVAQECWDDAIEGRDEGIRAGRILPPVDTQHSGRMDTRPRRKETA